MDSEYRVSLNTRFVKFLSTTDDARIYNRALSASEVMQLYKMGK